MGFVRTSKAILFAAVLPAGTLSFSVPATWRTRSHGPNVCDVILQEARRAGLDPALVDAVVRVESDYRADTVGAAGEIGLMQAATCHGPAFGVHGFGSGTGRAGDQYSTGRDVFGEGLETCPRRLVSCPHEITVLATARIK